MTTEPWKGGKKSLFIPKWLSTLFLMSIFAPFLRTETLIERFEMKRNDSYKHLL